MAHSNLNYPSDFHNTVFGRHGFEYIISSTDTTVAGKEYNAIQVITSATISCTTALGDNLSDLVVPAGMTIVGLFSAIDLSGGSVLAYKAA